MLCIGIPKEIKGYENRVSIVPKDLIELMNYYKSLNKEVKVFIQRNVGKKSGYSDEEYLISDCIRICETIEEVYKNSKLIIKYCY